MCCMLVNNIHTAFKFNYPVGIKNLAYNLDIFLILSTFSVYIFSFLTYKTIFKNLFLQEKNDKLW